jgi:AcrR family transcriptional regulator
MSSENRRRQLLEQATEFFAENGLTAQTRALAAACGVSQRLLYRYFPTKDALLDEIYRTAIAGPFKAVWFAELSDRSKPLSDRLTGFYNDYFATIFTARWLKLFMYASLANMAMAPNYTSSMVLHLLDVVVTETAHDQGIEPPEEPALRHELGWTLHGALSHYAIRQHLYGFPQRVPEQRVVAIQVAQFLGGFKAAVEAAVKSA